VQSFQFQRSLEAKGSTILSLIFGDGGADFSWVGSRNKAKTHAPRDCEVASNGIPTGGVMWGFKPTEDHLMFSWPVCSTSSKFSSGSS
jgi:hypothetical protein